MNYNFTFEEIVYYAEQNGYEHRGEPSRAKDFTFTFWMSPWSGEVIMVLYEGERRILRGHETPEVCWICIYPDGSVGSIPSRYLRRHYIQQKGFAFSHIGKQRIADFYKEDNKNGKENQKDNY